MATYYVNKSSAGNGTRCFTVSGITTLPNVGDTYTNNAITFTYVGANTTGTTSPTLGGYLMFTGSGAPAASGNLTRVTGSGDGLIAFSAYQLGGSSVTAAYKTIQGGLGLMTASGDVVIVGSGLYNEKINTGSTGSNVYTLYADGVVVLDGTGINNSNPAVSHSNGSAYGAKIDAHPNGGLWIIQNHACVNLFASDASGNNMNGTVTISNVICLSNGNVGGYIGGSGPASSAQIAIRNCIFSGFTVAIQYGYGLAVYNTTIYTTKASSIGIRLITNTTTYLNYFLNNIISGCTTAYNLAMGVAGIGQLNNNLYYNVTNWVLGTNTYTSLAQVQALNPLYETLSLVADPQFTDPANNIFYLKAPVSGLPSVGAYPYSFTQAAANDSLGTWHITASADNSGWYNPESNILKDGTTGYFYLSTGTTGTLYSPVYDIGSVQSISQVNLSKSEYWPYCMVDTTITDVRPNKQTIELRASTLTFTQDSSAVTWYEITSDVPFSPMTGRYTQVRMIMRTNDVGA